MYRNYRVAVVVPAYNEEGLVGEVIDTMPPFVDHSSRPPHGSTVGTWDEIRRRARGEATRGSVAKVDGGVRRPRVIPLRHRTNGGVGAAIKTGYRASLEDDTDVVAVMNGDGQMDPDRLDAMLDPIVDGRADYTKGDRLRSAGDHEEMPRWRFVGNVVLTFLTKVASGYWHVNDPQNGYTAISRSALETLDVDSLYDGFGFCNDLLVRLNSHGFRVQDVETRAQYGSERSHIRYSTFVPQLSRLLLGRFLWRLKAKYVLEEFHPLVLFYGIGQLGLLAAVVAVAGVVFAGAGGPVALLVAVLIFMVACLATAWAMAFDRRYSERYGRATRRERT